MSEAEDLHKKQKEAVARQVALVNRFCFGRCVKSPQRSLSVEQEHCLSTAPPIARRLCHQGHQRSRVHGQGQLQRRRRSAPTLDRQEILLKYNILIISE